MVATYKSSLETITAQCDHCGRTSQVAHVEGETGRTSWLLCAPCAKPNYPDAVIRAALEARFAHKAAVRQARKAEALAKERGPYTPPPSEPYSRCYAAGVVVRNWNQEEIDDRQADRLCATIWAGGYDDPGSFYQAIRCARVRHAARWHRELGPCDPRRKHRSGLTYNDLWQDRDSLTRTERWRDPEPLRLLIHTLVQTLALPVDPDWQRGDASWVWTDDVRIGPDGKRVWVPYGYPERCALLKRRYVWLTGQEWAPYTVERMEAQ